jgi:acyl-CoA synthetase (AMP-forming)/AMP-acid ligase II
LLHEANIAAGVRSIIVRGDGTRDGLGLTEGDPYCPEWQKRGREMKSGNSNSVEDWNASSLLLMTELQNHIRENEKDMIIVSGFKVFPNEVEAVLATHPKILEAGVIGVEDPHSGEVVKAFIVKKAEDLTEKDVIEHCKKNLTNYKIPKYITFVPSLPKTNVGKVLRKDLRKAA